MDRSVLLMRIVGGSAVVRLFCYPVSLLFAPGGDAQAIGRLGRSALFGILIGLLFLGLATVPVEVKASNAHGGESTVEISATVTAHHVCDNGTAVTNPGQNQGLVGDCEALLHAKEHLDPDGYLDWSVDRNIESWEGVGVSGSPKRVTYLLYQPTADSTEKLGGSLPAELGDLAHLAYLYLSGNSLTGEIPAELGNLANLAVLWLDDNSLTGEIPEELGNLANLAGLLLHRNSLSGEIPEELGNLANLTALWLYGNDLTGGIPEELGNLANLAELYSHRNSLTGEIPGELGNPANLAVLWLQGNNLTGEIPAELGNLANLTYLRLDHNSLSGEIPEELGNLAKLTRLWLQGNDLTGGIPAELGNLASLTHMYSYDNSLTGEIPEELGNLGNLAHLHLYGNSLTGEIPAELGNLANLTDLHLHDNSLTGRIPVELGNLANLTGLSLENNSLTGGIPAELGNLANLVVLWLLNNSLTGEIPVELGSLGSLEVLHLDENGLTGTIPAELGKLNALMYLYLNDNQLAGAIPPELGNLDNAVSVHIHCNRLSGAIPSELGNADSLEFLGIGGNRLTPAVPDSLSGVNVDTEDDSCGSAFNENPAFLEESPISREVLENTPSGENIGPPVTASDPNGDLLSYSLSGPGAASFSLNAATGQLLSLAPLHRKTKPSYQVDLQASDSYGGLSTVRVTINIIRLFIPSPQLPPPPPANQPPVFNDNPRTSRRTVENSPAGTKVGRPIIAQDQDSERIQYQLSGPGHEHFSLGRETGQLSVKLPLDYETQDRYALSVSATDDGGATSQISLSVYVMDLKEPPERPLAPGLSSSAPDELTALWIAPVNPGPGEIISYQLQYRSLDAPTWSNVTVKGISSVLFGLEPDTLYEVQVRATNIDAPGPWSPSSVERTLPDSVPAGQASAPLAITTPTPSATNAATPQITSNVKENSPSETLPEGTGQGSRPKLREAASPEPSLTESSRPAQNISNETAEENGLGPTTIPVVPESASSRNGQGWVTALAVGAASVGVLGLLLYIGVRYLRLRRAV